MSIYVMQQCLIVFAKRKQFFSCKCSALNRLQITLVFTELLLHVGLHANQKQ